MVRLIIRVVVITVCLTGLASLAFGQTKVYLPVVAQPGSARGVPGLTMTDFKIEGLKGLTLESLDEVGPELAGKNDQRVPVFILYDAFLGNEQVQTEYGQQLMRYMEAVAKNNDPVSLVVNTPAGLRAVHNFGTNPAVLLAALESLKAPGYAPADPNVKAAADALKVLTSHVTSISVAEGETIAQLGGLERLAEMLGRSPNRKAVLWMTWQYRFGTGEFTKVWTGSSDIPNMSIALGGQHEDTRFINLPPTYQHTIDMLNQAHVSVYPLQIYDRRDTSVTITNKRTWFTAEGLKQVAACTGGFSFKDYRGTTLEQAVAQIRADFGPYYLLTASAPEIKRTDWIPLKVKLDRPDVTLRTSPGFLGLSPGMAKMAGRPAK